MLAVAGAAQSSQGLFGNSSVSAPWVDEGGFQWGHGVCLTIKMLTPWSRRRPCMVAAFDSYGLGNRPGSVMVIIIVSQELNT